jgi:hypothetical protein
VGRNEEGATFLFKKTTMDLAARQTAFGSNPPGSGSAGCASVPPDLVFSVATNQESNCLRGRHFNSKHAWMANETLL